MSPVTALAKASVDCSRSRISTRSSRRSCAPALPYPDLAVLQTRIKALRVSIEPPETQTRRVATLPNKHMEGISRRSVLTPGRRAGGLVRCADGATCGELRVSELLPLMP